MNEPTADTPSRQPMDFVPYFRAIVGGVLGGLVGYLIFRFALRYGFAAHIVPMLGVGLGASRLSGRRGKPFGAIDVGIGAISAVIALVGILLIHHQHFEFEPDETLAQFIRHIPDISPPVLLMMAVGTVLAFITGMGR